MSRFASLRLGLAGREGRNVLLLALCQALAISGNTIVLTATALTGSMLLGPDKTLSTLPLALQFSATMLVAVPASFLMKQFGRRFGFSLGALLVACGGAVSVLAIFQDAFLVFCLGSILYGLGAGFALFYRFAAADSATPEFRPTAISLVMTGGVLAAVIGPWLARETLDTFAPVTFAGSFAAISVLALGGFTLLQFIDIPRLKAEERQARGRPLLEIASQPLFVIAVLTSMIGYGVMSLVMTATPLAMTACTYSFDQSSEVIQWHVVAMFAPSFFTGYLIKHHGAVRVIAAGAGLLLAAVCINLTGVEWLQFLAALVLLGLGWNLTFVGASSLLTETYRPEERAKVQAVNDMLTFGTIALTAFTAGYVQQNYGWEKVNLAVLPLILTIIGVVIWLGGHHLRPGTTTATAKTGK